MADKRKVRFHIAGIIPILIGAGGAFLSLFWDVISKGTAFKMSAVGPYKLLGLAAGLALIAAGVLAGFILGRRAAARTGTGESPSQATAYRLTGILLVIGGLGGTFLSLLWDVIRRGKSFSTAAIGPMKLMGIAAGIVLVVIGIVMVVVLARRKPVAPAQKEMPVQAAAAGVHPDAMTQPQVAGSGQQAADSWQQAVGYPMASAPDYSQQTADAGALQPELQQPQEEIPFALPVEEAYPAQTGTAPMEAIPVEEPLSGEHNLLAH